MRGILIATALLLSACGADSDSSHSGTDPSANPPPQSEYPNAEINIPVVVHVMYRDDDDGNISDSKIHSQIAVLNQAFNGANNDLNQVPDMFQPLIADMQIRFSLATHDPDGNPSNGITRTRLNQELAPEEYRWDYRYIYYSDFGGIDTWPREHYLNIWVLDSRDRSGRVAFAGRASFPGGPAEEDGVQVSTYAFGTEPPLDIESGVDMGKTLIHEVGHWLGLYHLAGTAENCNIDDEISDTPLSASNYGGLNPSHPVSSCGSVDMFMNYMALARDPSLLMFSQGQKAAVWSVLNEGGERHSLLEQYRQSQTND